MSVRVWQTVDELIDRAPGPDALAWHGLHLLAVHRWRQLGRPVDSDFENEARLAALRSLATPALLERTRAAYDGQMILIKGYEVALHYEDPALRPFVDLDLLVEDSAAAQRSLLKAGFIEVDDPAPFVDIHHLRPLALPDIPLKIELHHEPKWPTGLGGPPTAELFASAIPSSSGIDGIATVPAAQHALLIAVHSWAHLPLSRLRELVDIALLVGATDENELTALASDWGLERLWRTTMSCVDAIFYGGRTPPAQRIWARHLAEARERSVFESHVEKWLSSYWALPPAAATSVMVSVAAHELQAAQGETGREKVRRVLQAFRNASAPRSQHERELGPAARRRPRE